MIHGVHAILYSPAADADRDFFRDVLRWPFADAGHGWLIFALPPAELAFHPADEGGRHELYLMCDDIEAFASQMRGRGLRVSPPREERWGIVTTIELPSGASLGVYQPKHPSPLKRPKHSATKTPRRKQAPATTNAQPRPASRKQAPASTKAQPRPAPNRRAALAKRRGR